MSNEITVKIKGNLKEFYKMLEERNYKIVDKFTIDDTFFIPKNLEIDNITTREILSKAVLIRNIVKDGKSIKKITFKIKDIDKNGNILSQSKIDCDILNIDDAKNLLDAIGFKEIMNIKERDVVYEKDGIPLAIKNIANGDNLIEVETEDKDGFRTIEELKETINKLDIPIETDNYFVKKAEVELEKILKR